MSVDRSGTLALQAVAWERKKAEASICDLPLNPEHETPQPALILIAEDEGPIAALISALIEDLGYQPQVAENGRQALDMALASWPALLLTDLMMPIMSGTELISAMRAAATTTGRPVPPMIVMTAAGAEPARQAGADAVLAKPFDLFDLEQLVTDFLDGASS